MGVPREKGYSVPSLRYIFPGTSTQGDRIKYNLHSCVCTDELLRNASESGVFNRKSLSASFTDVEMLDRDQPGNYPLYLASSTGACSVSRHLSATLSYGRQITGLEPSSAFLFKSALYPCVIEFTVKRDGVHKPSGGMSLNESTASAASETTADPMVAPIDGSTSNSSGSISDSTKEESGSSSGMGVSGLAGGTAAAVAAAVTGPGGNESQPDADDGTGDNLGRGSSSKRGGGGGVNTSGSSWLGQGVMAMGKESSYKVSL